MTAHTAISPAATAIAQPTWSDGIAATGSERPPEPGEPISMSENRRSVSSRPRPATRGGAVGNRHATRKAIAVATMKPLRKHRKPVAGATIEPDRRRAPSRGSGRRDRRRSSSRRARAHSGTRAGAAAPTRGARHARDPRSRARGRARAANRAAERGASPRRRRPHRGRARPGQGRRGASRSSSRHRV